MREPDVLELTRSLLRFDTVNPPGRERDCARHAGALLEQWGFRVEYHEFAERRTSVIARAGGSEAKAPLCLTGHLDTVPLGVATWSRDPFAGDSDGDRLYGRGSSDMKAGVAAMLVAARACSRKLAGTPGVVLVLTAAEEGGCVGSRHLAALPRLLGRAGAIVVGEPTANYPLVGHKGTLKFEARFTGVAAHGSMPHLGVNAIFKAARALAKLEAFEFGTPVHAIMGAPTLNVGTIAGGNTINSVPDAANFGIDVRTVPGMDHAVLLERMRTLLGEDTGVEILQDAQPVWTSPEDDWVQTVYEVCARYLGSRPEPRTASYSTDAGNLLKVYSGAPTVVLGPGEPQLAHQTDEYCSIERMRESIAIYEELILRWCGG